MNDNTGYYKDALLYRILEKERLFSLITLLLNNQNYDITLFNNEISLQSHLENFIKGDNDSKYLKTSNSICLLLIDKLLWIFVKDIEKNEKFLIYIEEYFNKVIDKVNVTEKVFIESLFINEFSDNLLEITVDDENSHEFLAKDSIYGSQINYSHEYEQIIVNNLTIFSYTLQPTTGKNVITFLDRNTIEFSKHMKLTEMINSVKLLSNHYYNYIRD
ncbi:hypothetical protein P8831_15735 [Priestia megaterium]|uniref:hypothetical protein n=1 Tax=Priestia megaterium TaxID=1404 RepID=UPI002D805F6E|nr:hypothetical protein [Priestia megaterium]MEB4870177.1 hypothetical protein [Priestia megaterium]